MNDVAADQIPIELWSKMTDTPFRIRGDEAVQLILVTVTQAPDQVARSGGAASAKTETFSLVFRGPSQPALRQNIYTLEHDQLSRFDLFLVPIGRTADDCEYEAVFNRLARPQ